MADAPGYLLSESAIRKMAATIHRLENEVYQLKQRLGQTQYPEDWPRELGWGKTSKRSDSNYPSNATKHPENNNVYWVELANVAFDYALAADVAGGLSTTLTVTSEASNFVQARSMAGEGVPEGSVQVIERHWTLNGWRYWIRPKIAVWYRAKAAEVIVVGDSGKVNLLDSADATLMQVTAYYNWMTTNASDLVTSQELIVAWFEQDGRWRIIEWDCT